MVFFNHAHLLWWCCVWAVITETTLHVILILLTSLKQHSDGKKQGLRLTTQSDI